MRRLLALLCSAIALGWASVAGAGPALFDAVPLTDAELAEARGGFSLPSGVKIDFGAVVTTNVDGIRLLQTALQINSNGVTSSVSAANGVTVSINGTPATGDGTATQGSDYLQTSVDTPDLSVRHLIGRQVSSLIINTADNRTVDNQVSINLRLDNVEPLTLGSVGFRIQALGLEAMSQRVP